ncbi:MAG: LysM peptidoglycan-binding domain-containing protein [Candidatus Latescibacterota bacterium]|nr:MAG: LysM peptidoglycan-binding domain-containing protein [Candidatus Latescibacterota bacterium]
MMIQTKTTLIILLIVSLVVTMGFVVSGCGGSKHRQIDVSEGDYYSEDEIEALPASKRSRYCQDLQAVLGSTRQEFDAKTQQLEETRTLTRSLRDQIVPIEREVLQLESDIRTLNDQIEEVKALPTEYVIKEGESLTAIAMRPEIYNDIDKWERIFQANQDKIDDPYFIFPDTVLVIPRDWPTD